MPFLEHYKVQATTKVRVTDPHGVLVSEITTVGRGSGNSEEGVSAAGAEAVAQAGGDMARMLKALEDNENKRLR